MGILIAKATFVNFSVGIVSKYQLDLLNHIHIWYKFDIQWVNNVLMIDKTVKITKGIGFELPTQNPNLNPHSISEISHANFT